MNNSILGFFSPCITQLYFKKLSIKMYNYCISQHEVTLFWRSIYRNIFKPLFQYKELLLALNKVNTIVRHRFVYAYK